MKKETIIIKNRIFIFIIILILGIIPSTLIKLNNFFHRGDCLEIVNLEDAIYNDCRLTENGIEIQGSDPYIVVGGFDTKLKNIELIWEGQERLSNIQLYFDEGKGFHENDSLKIPFLSSTQIYRLKNQRNISSIRVDFDSTSDTKCIDLQRICLNSNWFKYFNNSILIRCAFVLVFSLLVSWGTMKFTTIAQKEIASLVVSEVVASISLYGFLWINSDISILYCCIIVCLTAFLSQLICFKNEKNILYTFLVFIFLVLIFWICCIPYNGAPDEAMRYDIVNYIVKYHKIPIGEEAEIRNGMYGFSYAFFPINIYILDALFVGIASLFTSEFSILIVMARIPNVLLALGTVAFTYGIAKEKLSGRAKWIFLLSVMLLPQLIFLFSYVNCDGIAIFSFAWIVYYLIKAEKKKWPLKECLMLGLGIGICLLSYYNAYSVILTTVIYCVVSVLKDNSIDNKLLFLLQRTSWVFIPAFLYAGWWFIRGAIYHNGDILGMTTMRKYGEMYGIEGIKPSQRSTPNNMGLSLNYMLFDMGWIEDCALSFVAVFGWLNYAMPIGYYQIYYGSIGLAILIACLQLGKRSYLKYKKGVTLQTFRISSFGWYMFANAIISYALAIYYSFFNDFQAQGRYYILAVFPIMYMVSKCLEIDVKSDNQNGMNMRLKNGIQILYALFFVIMFECAFVFAFIQNYL